MKHKFEDPFYFTRSEQRGIIILVVVMVFTFFIQNGIFFIQNGKTADQMIQVVVANNLTDSLKPTIVDHNLESENIKVNPVPANRNYKTHLKTSKSSNNVGRKYTSRYRPNMVSINKATAMEFERLPGIGPVFSNRIVKFRNKLGGFHSINQVAQVYGLPDSTFNSIRKYLKIDTPHSRLPFNLITTDSLAQHPYISWKQARILTNYRDQRKGIDNINQLFAIKAFDSTYVQKIIPYLK